MSDAARPTRGAPRLTRRGFLAFAGTSAALSALAGLRPGAAAAGGAAATAGARFFAEREREILTLVVERLVDTGEPGAPSVRETGTVATLDALCAGLDPALSRPLPTLMRLVEWGPLVFDFTFTRFSRMSPEQRDASLRAWMTSRLALRRKAFFALRNLAFLGWWSQPETWRLIGYAGPLLGPGSEA